MTGKLTVHVDHSGTGAMHVLTVHVDHDGAGAGRREVGVGRQTGEHPVQVGSGQRGHRVPADGVLALRLGRRRQHALARLPGHRGPWRAWKRGTRRHWTSMSAGQDRMHTPLTSRSPWAAASLETWDTPSLDLQVTRIGHALH